MIDALLQVRRQGFTMMPAFFAIDLPMEDSAVLEMECLSGRAISFHNHSEVAACLYCLAQFHRAARFVPVGSDGWSFPTADKKLHKRRDDFVLLLDETSCTAVSDRRWQYWRELVKSGAALWLSCADDALAALSSDKLFRMKHEAVIGGQLIHGDTAAHNFMIDHTGAICLIDFDLIHHDAPVIDLWQFISRLLFEKGWSMDILSWALNVYNKYNAISLEESRIICQLLLFPADILREVIGTGKGKKGYRLYNCIRFLERFHRQQAEWLTFREALKQRLGGDKRGGVF